MKQDLDPNRRIAFTRHAVQRIKEFGLTEQEARYKFQAGIEEKVPHRDTKQKKYGNKNKDIRYRSYVMYSFVYVPRIDKDKGDPIYLIITVGDKRRSTSFYKGLKKLK